MPQNITPEDYARLHGMLTPASAARPIILPQQEGLGSLSQRVQQATANGPLLAARPMMRGTGQAPPMAGTDVRALLAELLKQQTP